MGRPRLIRSLLRNSAEPQFSTIPTLDEWKNLWALWDTRDIGHDPTNDATPEADRFASQVLVLLGSHSSVRRRENRSVIAGYLTGLEQFLGYSPFKVTKGAAHRARILQGKVDWLDVPCQI
jgi:hypothetical protein